MESESKIIHPPASLVAIAGWIVPGAGYWLLGQRGRSLVIGVTIIVLFLAGLLIATVRAIDVPGYDEKGRKVMIETREEAVTDDSRRRYTRYMEYRVPQDAPRHPNAVGERRWALMANPFSEIIGKPWYMGEFLVGPLNLIFSMVSLRVAQSSGGAVGAHARLAEIGTLYTAIAGMLNLLAIIDSTHRATTPEGKG